MKWHKGQGTTISKPKHVTWDLENDKTSKIPSPSTTNNNTPQDSSYNIFLNGKLVTSISREAMSIIAAYVVLLEKEVSPRDEAILRMNSLMGNYYKSLEQRHSFTTNESINYLQQQQVTIVIIMRLTTMKRTTKTIAIMIMIKIIL